MLLYTRMVTVERAHQSWIRGDPLVTIVAAYTENLKSPQIKRNAASLKRKLLIRQPVLTNICSSEGDVPAETLFYGYSDKSVVLSSLRGGVKYFVSFAWWIPLNISVQNHFVGIWLIWSWRWKRLEWGGGWELTVIGGNRLTGQDYSPPYAHINPANVHFFPSVSAR